MISQPFAASPSQSAKGAVQEATAQLELAQVAVALGVLQSLPQLPQLFASLAVFTHAPPGHKMEPAGQPETQAYVVPDTEQMGVPPLHPSEAHPPQCALEERSVSQPFAAIPSQSAKPGLHDAIAQADLAQVAVAFARAQTMPHPPQFFGSLAVLTSQPVDARLSQSA